tara:strand:- start:5191 stop:6237 length:1047 start_codon:yes stop_codon:yes gene_type:complete
MNNYQKNSILIILEEDLNNRFNFFISATNINVIKLNLQNIYGNNLISTAFKRFHYRKNIQKVKKVIYKNCVDKKDIFISNAEGFIAINIISELKKVNPESNIIALQHGIFQTTMKKKFKNKFIFILNFFCNIFFGLKLFGLGFGPKVVDRYIVYCKEYKDILIKHGWEVNDIIISSFFLKGRKYFPSKNIETAYNNNVILALQPLSSSGIVKKNTEVALYEKLIKKLLNKFDKVFIRQHPFNEVNITVNSNRLEFLTGDEITTELEKASTVVSFFSSVLLEYEYLDKTFIAVYSNKLKKYRNQYKIFKNIHNLEDDLFNYVKNEARKRETFFQTGVSNIEELLELSLK